MKDKYVLKNFKEKDGTKINLNDFYSKLSESFSSIKAQELSSMESKLGGMVPNPTLINFYPLGRNQSLIVTYYLNPVFGANCENIREITKSQRVIERIEIIPKNLDSSYEARLERLISHYQ